MNQQRILSATMKLAYHIVKMFGLFPASYNHHLRRFETSYLSVAYAIVLLVSFAYIFLTSGVAVISALSPLIAVAFTNLSVTTICATIVLQCIHHKKFVNFINQSKHLLEQLNTALSIDLRTANMTPQIIRLAFKVIFVNFMAQFALISAMHTLLVQITGSKDYVSVFIVSVAYFLQSMVPNLIFVALQLSDFYLIRMNDEVESVIQQSFCLQNSTDLRYAAKTFRYCQCSDRLDQLAELHQTLTDRLVDLNDLFSIQLLFNTMNFFGIFVIELFLIYLLVADSVITGGKVMDLAFVSYIVLYVTAIMLELLQLCNVCNRLSAQVNNSAASLHSVVLSRVDRRLTRSIDLFSLQLLNQKIRFKVTGMFTLDNELFTAIAASTFSYLALLIQYHLPRAQEKVQLVSDTKLKSF